MQKRRIRWADGRVVPARVHRDPPRLAYVGRGAVVTAYIKLLLAEAWPNGGDHLDVWIAVLRAVVSAQSQKKKKKKKKDRKQYSAAYEGVCGDPDT